MEAGGKLFAILGREHSVIDQVGFFEGNRLLKLTVERRVAPEGADGTRGSPGRILYITLYGSSVFVKGQDWQQELRVVS